MDSPNRLPRATNKQVEFLAKHCHIPKKAAADLDVETASRIVAEKMAEWDVLGATKPVTPGQVSFLIRFYKLDRVVAEGMNRAAASTLIKAKMQSWSSEK